MSFIGKPALGATYAPGWFLADHENVTRKTRQIAQKDAVTAETGGKYVPMGTVWPANDATAEGIVYEDVDVTSGDMPGSVVLSGKVYTNRLPAAPSDEAKASLEAKGFLFLATAPDAVRPY